MKVVLTAAARQDLIEIGDRIAVNNPQRARSFVVEIIAAARQIGGAPRAYPLVPSHQRLKLRRRVHGNYLIFYRIARMRVEVLHVTHGARDPDSVLSEVGRRSLE